jgi:hypothetical protein
MSVISRRLAVATVLAAGAAAGVASSAHAAQQTIPLMCDGTLLTVRTPSNSANQSYSVGQIVDGGSGHLIPLSFTFTFTPTGGSTITQTSVKGGGNAGPKDATVTCTATFDDPDGTGTISVTAVPRP